MVEDIRKMTSQAQVLVSVVQYRRPLGVQTKEDLGGVPKMHVLTHGRDRVGS